MQFETLTLACHSYVQELNAIPMSVIEKIQQANSFDLQEVTPPSIGDRVYICNDEWRGKCGEIVGNNYDGEDDLYEVRIDGEDGEYIISEDCIEVLRDDALPMWGTMWAFGDNIDNEWLSGRFGENGLRLMANCGFRIYKSEDYEYVFGIDGAGYDFYEAHWIPLYKARGLRWHKVDDTVKEDTHA